MARAGAGKVVLMLGLFGGAIAVGMSRARAQQAPAPKPPARPRSANLPAWLATLDPIVPVHPPSQAPSQAPVWAPVLPTRSEVTAPTANGSVAQPTLDVWARALAPGCLQHGIQLPYALKWGDLESGWNPCAIGYPPAHGRSPDGKQLDAPLEMGVAQFYNPDDLVRLKLTGKQLRAYCVPGDQHESIYKGKKVRGFSQEMSRNLTDAEIQDQADGAVGLIKKSMSSATHDLMSVGAGSSWSPSTRNYWTLVKLQHGLPEVSSRGLPLVKAHLGRAPRDWSEFRTALSSIKFPTAMEQKYRGDLPRILDNAEECASAFSERSIA